ncbi:MAG: PKD domain-containing protein [Patescibacteria group bacterium]|nr:PKD domain-containing protein [Patescibacteria group bacterium]
MIKKSIVLIISLFVCINAAQAASGDIIELGEAIGNRPLEAVITAPTSVEAGRLVVFDGTRSYNPKKNSPLRYFWEFGDGTTSISAEVGHRYEEPGRYIIKLTVANDYDKTFIEHSIVVYKNRAFLISDGIADPKVINTFQKEADAGNILLDEVRTTTTGTDFGSERIIVELMKKRQAVIDGSPLLILWTDEARGLAALTSFAQENKAIDFSDKTILAITNSSIDSISPFGKIAYRVLNPREIIISSPDAVYTSLLVRRDAIAETLKTAEKDFIKIDRQAVAFRGYNFMSQGVIYLLAHGMPQHSLTLLLMLPLLALVAVIAKHIIGLNTIGVYMPSILAIGLVAIGFWPGLAILFAIVIALVLFRHYSKNLRLMQYPKMAISAIIITLVITVIIGITAFFGNTTLANSSVFPILMVVLIAERFSTIQIANGLSEMTKAFIGTLIVAIAGYGLIEKMGFFKTLFLIHPEAILIVLVLCILIGKWRGLRLLEQWRFWELREYDDEEV